MKQTDLYYRAFREYREITARERENQNQRRSIAASGVDQDRLETVKNICVIDEEWVKEIEKGLVFVEKAIREEFYANVREQSELLRNIYEAVKK